MDVVGKRVTHMKYGEGKIVEVEGGRMKVDFGSEVRGFQYPEAFERYFTIGDKRAEKYIFENIQQSKDLKRVEHDRQKQVEQLREHIRKSKINVNSHAAFGVTDSDIEHILETGELSTGSYVTGINKGKPRLPQKLNMNSACLLTMRAKGSLEAERVIVGVSMVAEDFVGAECTTGMIPLHEKYRILWDSDQEELLFWNYFSNDAKLKKWQGSEMKYVSASVIEKVLADMQSLASDEKKEDIAECARYFNQINRV